MIKEPSSNDHILKINIPIKLPDSSSESEENTELNIKKDHKGVNRYMGPPNPLIDKDSYPMAEVKTAFKINFGKLPSLMAQFFKTNKTPVHNSVSEKKFEEDIGYETKPSFKIQELDSEGFPKKTLFDLYPPGGSKEVYRKYKNITYEDQENPIYAGYFVDLVKFAKNKKKFKTQYFEKDDSPDPTLRANNTPEIEFSSMFESGNLYAAYKVDDYEYDLILQNDVNTKGYTQWFYFSVKGVRKNIVIKFNIINLLKPESLFSQGMKPVAYSTSDNKETGEGWKRGGFNISYYKNNILRENTSYSASYYTLSFSYRFRYNNDTVYFAHCFPYTYSDLSEFLGIVCTHPVKRKYTSYLPNNLSYLTRKVLCKTLAKNDCEYITITSEKNLESIDQRFGISLIARQHPGETLSSYVAQGLIDFLLSEEEEAKFIRQNCVVKIVPMMNPDGVIHGNYRTGLAGSDLNRKWKRPQKNTHPTVYYAKEMIKDLQKARPTIFFCDLHGHSNRKNAFLYGNTAKDPISCRIFPMLFSKMSPYICFEDCRFVVQKDKEATARISLWRELGCDNVFTLEGSFYGYTHGDKFITFTKEEYINMGADLAKTLAAYVSELRIGNVPYPIPNQTLHRSESSPSKKSANISRAPTIAKVEFKADNLIEELISNNKLIELGEKADDSGSESNPSQDDLDADQINKLLPRRATQKNKTQKLFRKTDFYRAATPLSQPPESRSAPRIDVNKNKKDDLTKSNINLTQTRTDSETQTEHVFFKVSQVEALASLATFLKILEPRPIKIVAVGARLDSSRSNFYDYMRQQALGSNLPEYAQKDRSFLRVKKPTIAEKKKQMEQRNKIKNDFCIRGSRFENDFSDRLKVPLGRFENHSHWERSSIDDAKSDNEDVQGACKSQGTTTNGLVEYEKSAKNYQSQKILSDAVSISPLRPPSEYDLRKYSSANDGTSTNKLSAFLQLDEARPSTANVAMIGKRVVFPLSITADIRPKAPSRERIRYHETISKSISQAPMVINSHYPYFNNQDASSRKSPISYPKSQDGKRFQQQQQYQLQAPQEVGSDEVLKSITENDDGRRASVVSRGFVGHNTHERSEKFHDRKQSRTPSTGLDIFHDDIVYSNLMFSELKFGASSYQPKGVHPRSISQPRFNNRKSSIGLLLKASTKYPSYLHQNVTPNTNSFSDAKIPDYSNMLIPLNDATRVKESPNLKYRKDRK